MPERLEPGAAPTVTADPKQQAILAAYENYLQARSEALHIGDPDHPGLTEHAGGIALLDVREDINANNTIGVRYDGNVSVVWAEVVPGEPDLPLPEEVSELVGVDACVDMSDFIPVRIEDGSSMLTEDAERGSYRGHASVAHFPDDDRWLVLLSEFDWEAPC